MTWVRSMEICRVSRIVSGCNFKKPFSQMYYEYIYAFILGCVCVCAPVEKAACMKFADRCLLHVKIVISITAKPLCQSEMPL